MSLSNIKILVVEDNPITADNMQENLKTLGYILVKHTPTSKECRNALSQTQYDIILMDIGLRDSDEDGIALAAWVNDQYPKSKIIFTTSFSDRNTILRSEKVIHQNYLVKPVTERQLFVSIEKALGEEISQNQQETPIVYDSIYIKGKSKFYEKVLYDDIIYIMSDQGSGSFIFSGKCDYFTYKSLQSILDKITSPYIIRVHRKYAVNIKNVSMVSEQEIETNMGTEIPIGPAYKEDVRKYFNRLK